MCTKEKKTTAPPLPPALSKDTPGVNKFRYKQQYGVIIVCQDEAEHQRTFEKITALGYKCKAVRV